MSSSVGYWGFGQGEMKAGGKGSETCQKRTYASAKEGGGKKFLNTFGGIAQDGRRVHRKISRYRKIYIHVHTYIDRYITYAEKVTT